MPKIYYPDADYDIDLDDIHREVQDAANDRTNYLEQQVDNYKTRMCIHDWPDKKDDPNAFPYQGASDQKIFYVDSKIRHSKALKLAALFKSRQQFEPVGGAGDLAKAKMWQSLWSYTFKRMRPRHAANLLADYSDSSGFCLAGVYWDSEPVILDESLNTLPPELLAKMVDPFSLEEEIVTELQGIFPDATDKEMIDALEALRSGTPPEEVTLPVVTYVKEGPCIVPYHAGRDFVIPPDTCDIQLARFIAILTPTSKEDLEYDADRYDYDKEVVAEILDDMFDEHGNAASATTSATLSGASDLKIQQDTQYGLIQGDTDQKHITIVHHFKKILVAGKKRVLCTVYCADKIDKPLKVFWLNYKHGKYPLVVVKSEDIDENIHSSRGYPQLFRSAQDELKIQADARADRTNDTINPMLLHPIGRPPTERGPGSSYGYVTNADELKYLSPPQYDPTSLQVEATIKGRVDDYLGSMGSVGDGTTPESSKGEANIRAVGDLLKEYDIENWLDAWGEIIAQCVALMQQFMPDEIYYRVVEDPNVEPIKVSIQEIQGQFDVYPVISVQDLMPAYGLEAAKQIVEAALKDPTGTIDPSEAFKLWLMRLDARGASSVIRPAPAAQQAEVNKELDAIAKIYAGIPQQVEEGGNIQLRFQILQQYMSQPDIQSKMKVDAKLKERLETRVEQYQFQQQQAQNAVIGRQGAIST